ncbi:hypothetical protein [Methylobacillus sp.]|uniref:hypothetical protein n=1 Tax=Methylobacillus sp. TaxID=56818 RepID=UPI002FDF1C2F
MSNKPPRIAFRDADPLQDYYQDRNGDSYSVAKLIDDARHLKPFDMPIAGLRLSDVIWQGFNIYDLAFHCLRVNAADLDKPIILDWLGDIADGRHRVIRAIMEGKRHIKAVRMTWKPTPCAKGE